MRLIPVAAAAVLCAAFPARAAPLVRVGADYLLNGGPALFSLTLGVDTPLARSLSVGARFGALLTTDPTVAGVPLDLVLRASPGRLYLEGLVGPWIFFSGDAVHAHAAFGFGLSGRSVEAGLEIGWLGGFSRAMIGGRLGFRI